ncbi:hypothetical protein, partial [Streptomyces sp. NPDC019793]|uniref:hypothetical protein n=1 Tax=Streptomyces sp. NPDC019793 TaxID=3154692 RepID=UPI0033E3DB1C
TRVAVTSGSDGCLSLPGSPAGRGQGPGTGPVRTRQEITMAKPSDREAWDEAQAEALMADLPGIG